MKLLITPTSPFARKTRIAAIEKHLALEEEILDPWREFQGAAHLNPLNKIPILLIGEQSGNLAVAQATEGSEGVEGVAKKEAGKGRARQPSKTAYEVIYDSRVIIEYLDSLADSPYLLPREAAKRAIVKTQEAIADGVTEALAAIIMADRVSPSQAPSDKWRQWQLDKARRSIAKFGEEWESSSIKDEEPIHIGHIALGCALGYLDFRLPMEIPWRATYSKLASWFEELSRRPSFVQTAPIR